MQLILNTFEDTDNTPGGPTAGLACCRRTPRRCDPQTSSGLAGSGRLIRPEWLRASPRRSPDRPRPTTPPERSAVIEDAKAGRTAEVAVRTVLKESMQAHFDPGEPDHSSEAGHENRRHTARKTIPQHCYGCSDHYSSAFIYI